MHIIRNGYVLDDELRSHVATSADLHCRRRRYRIGVLCELTRKKGIDVLMEAVALAISDRIPVELKIGGTGPEEAALRCLADELGISESIQWLGWINDREAFFRGIDMYCLPSRSEPFGLVVIEAMATATPVIATRTDGPLDIIADGESGWLFPIDDHETLRNIIHRTFHDPENTVRIAAQGKLDAERRFRPEAAAVTIEHALLSILRPDRAKG